MKFDFTDGEWEYTESSNFSGTLVAFISDGNGKQLFQSRHSDSEFTNENCNADARLISCAPEMIKALIKIQKYKCNQCEDDKYCNIVDCRYFENIDIIEKALNKKWSEINDNI